ncbi:DUF2306 domain-containing protein [Actinoplanes sp. NPDC049599]|jgi:uncharacterized membrane protein|uniref:DUF2306 domain-containing protein n=1 Tax=Actinoplanes sp. NPDC049599 TaxID=3363903 RepID=UPI0037A197B2
MTKPASRTDRRVTVGLLVLSAVPVIAGASRVTQLTAGAAVTPANERFFAVPLPVVAHIIGASLFCLLGAFQFHRGLRRRRPRWHRLAGRVLALCGIVAALSGIWMTLYYPLPVSDGARFGVLGISRLGFGAVMAAAIVLSVVAIRRRDIVRHRAWMIRAYAIGLGAGTQVFTLLPWMLLLGQPGVGTRAVLMNAAWVINLLVAEWVIRRRPRRRSPVPAAPAGAPATVGR